MSMGGRSRFLTLPATVQACRDGLGISRRTGGTIRIHLPITRPISSIEFVSSYVPDTNRLRISHTPVSGTDCRHSACTPRREELRGALVERVCNPLGLERTRITLSPDMRKYLAQGHGLDLRSRLLWDFLPALQGAGAARSDISDMTLFLQSLHGTCAYALSGLFRATT